MRVLKNGILQRPVVRFVCKVCECEFEAEKHEYTMQNDFRNGYYYRARCPCCGKDVNGGRLVEDYLKARENRWKNSGRT